MEQPKNALLMPVVTIIAVVVAIILSFIGSGALGGTPINEAAGGALSADATPVAPDGPAFSIWSVIYAGLLGYAIYQLLPDNRTTARQTALRPWAVLSALLNAGWILVVQAGSVVGSLAVIVVLLAVLVRLFILVLRIPPVSWIDALVSNGTFGLYLGWVCVATTANAAALVASADVGTFPGWQWATVGVLAIVVAVGIVIALYSRGRIAPALAIVWGLAWIAAARTSGDFASPWVVWAAGIAAAAVGIATLVFRLSTTRKRLSPTESA